MRRVIAVEPSPDIRFGALGDSRQRGAGRCGEWLRTWGAPLSLLVLALGCGVGRTPLEPANRNTYDGAAASAADAHGASAVDAVADARASAPDTGGASAFDAAADTRAGSPDAGSANTVDVAGDVATSTPDTRDARDVDVAADVRTSAPDTPVASAVDVADGKADAPDTGDVDAADVGAEAGDADASGVDASGDAPASGLFLTVTVTGGGIGTVTSFPAGIQCGATCSAAFAASPVTLSARTTNGSDSRFAGWGGSCSGVVRDCTVALTSSTTVTARFEPIDHNLVFISSVDTYTSGLGSAVAYDGQCSQLATAAGINNATGDAFIAWVSDSHSSALSRLGTARGFMRMDGEPVADDPAAMLAQ